MGGYDGATSALIAVTLGSAYGPLSERVGLTARVTDRADGAVLADALPLTETPAGSGIYVGALPLLGVTAQRVGVAVDVDGQAVTTIAWMGSRFGCTRRDLRLRLARRLAADEWSWQVPASDGTTTAATLPDLAIGGSQEYRGLWVWFPDRVAGGAERRVTDFAPTPPVVTWSPAASVAVAAGELVELLPLRPSRLNEAIADALRLLDTTLLIDAEEACLVTDGSTNRLPLPPDAVQVCGVGLEPSGATPEQTDWLEPDAWWLEPGGILCLGARSGWTVFTGATTTPALAGGWTVRVRLRCRPPRPLHDLVWLPVLPEAIVDAAAEQIALALPEYRTMLPTFAQRASQSRLRATATPPGAARDVPR